MPNDHVEIGRRSRFGLVVSIRRCPLASLPPKAPAAANADHKELPPGTVAKSSDGQSAFFRLNEDDRNAGILQKISNVRGEEKVPAARLTDVLATVIG